ncbi:MAG: amidohydrolase [Clostridiales bacterium]|nr:amidohydrolase [Clostridiales bacterium]
MNIIDFHTHPFIKERSNVCFYDGIVTAENFRTYIEKAGISKICGSVIYKTEDFKEIKSLNREALKLKDMWGDFYIPGIHIHPEYVEESIEEIEYTAKRGVKLIGELVPYYNSWHYLYDDNLREIYKAADKAEMVISIHTDGETDMDGLEKAVKEFKNLKFAAAHPHQKAHYYRHTEMLKKYDNYYLDLSGTGLFRFGMLKTLVNNAGSEKILFGTDFPITNPKMYVEAVLFENLKDNDLENIFYKNSERLLF